MIFLSFLHNSCCGLREIFLIKIFVKVTDVAYMEADVCEAEVGGVGAAFFSKCFEQNLKFVKTFLKKYYFDRYTSMDLHIKDFSRYSQTAKKNVTGTLSACRFVPICIS